MEKSWKEAIKKVLAESEAPMHYTEISEQILSRGYYETDGATPAATVSAQLTSSIKHDGEKSPFLRVGKGGRGATLAHLHRPRETTRNARAFCASFPRSLLE